MLHSFSLHWFESKCEEYTDIPWSMIDEQWWTFPIEVFIVIICFVGFHVASENHLLMSLDSFSRSWNISHQTAQPTIYALGAVAPIIIISNTAFALDIFGCGWEGDLSHCHAHRLGVTSILGFGAATAALIPSSCVFCLVGYIIMPKTTTIRDGIFITILLLMFLILALTGTVLLWKSCTMAAVYSAYLFSIICFPKIKERFLSPNPMETNRLLNQLRNNNSKVDIFNRPIGRSSLLEHTDGYKGHDRESVDPPSDGQDSHFDSHSLLNHQQRYSDNAYYAGPAEAAESVEDHQILNHSNYTTIGPTINTSNMTSPDRKSTGTTASRNSMTGVNSLRHPMLMSEYDTEYGLGVGYPSDIDEVYENEESLTPSKIYNAEEDTNSVNVDKIFLRTPKGQNQQIMYNTQSIQFLSLNEQNFPNLPANTDSVVTKAPIRGTSILVALMKKVYKYLVVIYRWISFPVRILLQCTIPPCDPHGHCGECLYPLTFLFSIFHMIVYAILVICIVNHWHARYGWSLSIMGMVVIGPICTLSNIVDCCALSLQGYSAEVVSNSYHYQISNFFYGIILPLIATSSFNAIDGFHAYVTEAILIYLVVLVSQSVLLLVPLLCNSNNIELTRPKGWMCIWVYLLSLLCFYYFVSY